MPAARIDAESALALLLLFIPVTLVLEYLVHASPALLFASSALAIVPLAGLMGKSTEMLAMRGQVANDGETYWMEGVLLAVYGVLALAFFCLPAGAA